MKFCNRCFWDSELAATIERSGEKGSCDICGRRDVYIYDSENNPELIEFFIKGQNDATETFHQRINAEESDVSEYSILKNITETEKESCKPEFNNTTVTQHG